jgi:hypothetical protein
MTCSELAKYAFETHVECYTEPGYGSKSLCAIWASQNFVGLLSTLEIQDFFKAPTAITQVHFLFYEKKTT